MAPGRSLLLIADIGGYTEYMRTHRMSLAHAEVNTARLLEKVIDAAPGFELIEIEGDAAFLARSADASDGDATVALTLQAATAMHRAFHLERQYVATNLCPCDGCTQANNLKLKFVAHVGEVASQTIRQRRKLVGIDVILVHRLLKNPVEVPEYVLLSEELYRTAGDGALPGPAHEVSQDIEGIGSVRAFFVDVDGPGAAPSAAGSLGPRTPRPDAGRRRRGHALHAGAEAPASYGARSLTAPKGRRAMRRIGLLGGMSWESSVEYYRLLNELVRERLGGLHSADCLMYSVDFAPIAQMQRESRWEDAGEALAAGARVLEAGGAEMVLLCTNTMHLVADQVQEAVSIPLLHLIDVTAAAISRAGLTDVGLLATAFTMEGGFYVERLASHGITAQVPEADDRALVHRVIYEELCLGVVSDESRAAYRDVIDRLVARGAQGIILGCTEIELLIGPDDSPVPVFPTTRLHAEAAVDAALA